MVMTWIQRYHLRRFVRTSLLLVPMACLLAALLLAPVLRWLDPLLAWRGFGFNPEGARAVLGALTASMLTFIVFVLSSLLIVLQLAANHLSPRVIAQVLSDWPIKVVLGIFTFAFVLTLAALSRVEDVVPQLPVAVAVVGNMACILLFFVFVQQVGSQMRPVAVMRNVAEETRSVIESLYPLPYDPVSTATALSGGRPSSPPRVLEHTGRSGLVLAFNPADIVRLAREADACVELVPQVGDFIARGDPLFRVTTGRHAVNEPALRQCVAIGPERTIEQDPRFGFRILVDTATRALSPGINDPTTAVQCLDQLHSLLLDVGRRKLDAEEARDAEGNLRLVYRTPDWEDFLFLAVSEVRHYGGGSIQVDRRLRAMLDHLIRVLPEARHPPLRKELSLLQRAVERDFPDVDDRERAGVGDYQGIGGTES
jgi:uncharacterized membrane protein